MKFDIVAGNPPYNNDDYIPFVEIGHNISNMYSTFITPAKWQAKGDKKNKAFRQNIIPYMSKIIYYPDTRDIFEDVGETGGISYYLINKDKNSIISINTEIKNDKLRGEKRVNKIISLYNENVDNIIKKCSSSKIMDNLSFNFAYFVKDRTWGYKNIHDTELMVGEKRVGYIDKMSLNNQLDVDKYKIVTSATYGFPFDKQNMAVGTEKINILKPKQVPRNPSVVLKCFNTEQEALSMRSYIYSKLISFLFVVGVTGTSFVKEFWRFVPDPGTFDHIFTDEELYKKYNLTPEEINIIESVIKERKQVNNI